MKRTTIAISLAGFVLLGPAAVAEASTGHQHVVRVPPSCGCGHGHPGKHHGKKHGHPKPKPRPPVKHHPKPCPPPVKHHHHHHHHHHPRPVVHPRPPIVTPPAHHDAPKPPHARVRVVSPSAIPTQLAFTGMPSDASPLLEGAAAALLLGAAFVLAAGFRQSGPRHKELSK